MIITYVFRIQAYDSVMCAYLSIEFIDFEVECRSLINFTDVFSPNNFLKNYDIILSCFKNGWMQFH